MGVVKSGSARLFVIRLALEGRHRRMDTLLTDRSPLAFMQSSLTISWHVVDVFELQITGIFHG